MKEPLTDLNFQLKNIDLIETCINAPRQQLSANSAFQFEISLEHRISADEDFVFVICSVSIQNQTKEQVFGKIKASCMFEVKDLSQFIDEETRKLNLPETLVKTLNSISISTIRGVMFSMFRGTWLHNAILPIIDPRQFSKRDQPET